MILSPWHAGCIGDGVVSILQRSANLARLSLACGVLLSAVNLRGVEAPPKAASGAAELAKLLDLSNQQRDRMIADHDALARQLKDATDDKRREIYEKMSEQKKAFEAAQSALHKRIREEQRAQRALQRSR